MAPRRRPTPAAAPVIHTHDRCWLTAVWECERKQTWITRCIHFQKNLFYSDVNRPRMKHILRFFFFFTDSSRSFFTWSQIIFSLLFTTFHEILGFSLLRKCFAIQRVWKGTKSKVEDGKPGRRCCRSPWGAIRAVCDITKLWFSRTVGSSQSTLPENRSIKSKRWIFLLSFLTSYIPVEEHW